MPLTFRDYSQNEFGEQAEEFAIWCVGEDYKNLNYCLYPDAWNLRHPENPIKVTDKIHDNLQMMIRLYKESKKGDE